MRRPGSARDERLPRGLQPAGRPGRPKRLPDWWPRARALLQQGHSLKSVGETVGVSRQRVQQIASKAEGLGETFGRRRQDPLPPRPCVQCGTLFRPHGEKAAYCSRQCAGRARSERILPAETIRLAFELRCAGRSYWEIADTLSISPDRSRHFRQTRARHYAHAWARRTGLDPPGAPGKPGSPRSPPGN